jgi:hypothetical protein
LYLKVRLAVSEGMSQRQAAKHFNISRDSVSKMLAYSTPPGYRRQAPVRRPKLDAFVLTIEQWLEEDLKVPRKQRHTAKHVFDWLRDECGFAGGYTIIKDYMREREQRRQEVFVPLSHPPGHGQADFGEAMVVIGGVEQKARFFCLTCRTATPAMCGPIRRRWRRPGWMAISMRSPSSERFRSRLSTTMTAAAAWLRRSCLTARASGRRCSQASCPTT